MLRIPRTKLVLAVLLLWADCTLGQTPDEIFIVANRRIPESVALAEHYCRRRGVPKDNLITLELPTDEDIGRADYDNRLAAPLRTALQSRRAKIRVILTLYGVPLRVGPPAITEEQKAERTQLQAQEKRLTEAIKALGNTQDNQTQASRKSLEEQLQQASRRVAGLTFAECHASVDSELSLLWWGDYELRRWQPNYLNFQVSDTLRRTKPHILMVCRLDGPTPAIARGLVDTAMDIERKGLFGHVYVDARGLPYDPGKEGGYGYGAYDESLREMARLLDKEGHLPVRLDDSPGLFADGSCPDCALYCGWYSLAKYVDCCRFVPGAVAYHIASAEAVSLRNPSSTYWCKCLLEKGVAATLGPVAEPYTIGFPKPAEFFGLLVTGQYSLVECYYKTMYTTSWMTVLVGDPLYRPYARQPRLKIEQVKPSPNGARFPVRPLFDVRPR